MLLLFDQLIIGRKGTHDEFGASVSTRSISAPKKKLIKEKVPFSNVTYDFSAINGELYWEERELEYELEMIADSPESLERRKSALCRWLMNVVAEEIHDPYDSDYHFIGTFDDVDINDDEGMEKTVLTVTFSAYPYKIRNKATNHICLVPASSEQTFIITNESAHRITPTISTDAEVILTLDGVSYSVHEGTSSDDIFKLKMGANALTVKNLADTDCKLIISYHEEAF